MGIYIFNWDVLKKYLIEDEADPDSENDFGNNIIPNLLKDGRNMYAYHFDGYWKDVGTISSLWEANMEVLDPEHSGINLFDENWKIYSRNSGMTGHKIGNKGLVENSMVTDGCRVIGQVKHSCLFAGVNGGQPERKWRMLWSWRLCDPGRSRGEALYRGGKRDHWKEGSGGSHAQGRRKGVATVGLRRCDRRRGHRGSQCHGQ